MPDAGVPESQQISRLDQLEDALNPNLKTTVEFGEDRATAVLAEPPGVSTADVIIMAAMARFTVKQTGGPLSQEAREQLARTEDELVTVRGASSTSRDLPFKSEELLSVHYEKHGPSIQTALGRKSYTAADYVADANYVVRTGQYVPELNGYVQFMGANGRANYGFVGLDRASGSITTFHIKSVSELAKKAPSLGLSP